MDKKAAIRAVTERYYTYKSQLEISTMVTDEIRYQIVKAIEENPS